MDMQLLFTAAGTVVVAKLGDKTRFATLMFAGFSPVSLRAILVGAAARLDSSFGG